MTPTRRLVALGSVALALEMIAEVGVAAADPDGAAVVRERSCSPPYGPLDLTYCVDLDYEQSSTSTPSGNHSEQFNGTIKLSYTDPTGAIYSTESLEMHYHVLFRRDELQQNTYKTASTYESQFQSCAGTVHAVTANGGERVYRLQFQCVWTGP